MSKPHLVLNWLFDIPNQTLTCKIGDNLEYTALSGGEDGYIKRYRISAENDFEESTVTPDDWDKKEKFWISEQYGDLVGYYQPDYSRVVTHPQELRNDPCPMGIGPDGRYLDHMQRMQILLEGEDCARIATSIDQTLFVTPDNGKTIFKRVSTRDANYEQIETEPDRIWPEHPQPCMMQPRSPGVRLSSYEEMLKKGIDKSIVEKCKNLQWESPKHPELQQWYIYPTN